MNAQTRRCIDLNADVGEDAARLRDGREAALIAELTSANLACGGHAGDPDSMAVVVDLCRAHGVAIGAHPSYPDREHFGRRRLPLAPHDLVATIVDQVQALLRIARAAGTQLAHVKPHGALYHAAADDPQVTAVLIEAITRCDPRLYYVGRAGSRGLDLARAAGLSVLAEGFADRRYTAAGGLLDRGQPGAVLTDVAQVRAQALSLIERGQVQTDAGSPLPLTIDTLCLHSDTAGAEVLASDLRAALRTAGISVRAPSDC
jgi:UPF0271 protein